MRNGNAWVIGVIGIWLAITPFLGATPMFYTWNDWIVGIVAIVAGLGMVRARPVEGGVSAGLGIWLLIAGFIPALLFGAGLWWNNLLVGAGLAVFGFAALRRPTRAETPHRLHEEPGHGHRHPA